MNSLKRPVSDYDKETSYDLLDKQMYTSLTANGCCHHNETPVKTSASKKWSPSLCSCLRRKPLDSSNPRCSHNAWGCLVVLGSFITHLIIGGLERSNGIIYLKLVEEFGRSAVDTAWVVSLSSTAKLLLGPLATVLCNRFSCRIVAISGGIILAVGFLITSNVNKIEYLYVSFGLIGGVGRSFVYTPSVVIVTMYFNHAKGTAYGVASAGSGLGMLIVPPILQLLFTKHDFYKSMLMLMAVALFLCVGGSLYQQPPFTQEEICLRNSPETDRLSSTRSEDPDKYSPARYHDDMEPGTPSTVLSMDTTSTVTTFLKETQQDVNENLQNDRQLLDMQESIEPDSRFRKKLCHILCCCCNSSHRRQHHHQHLRSKSKSKPLSEDECQCCNCNKNRTMKQNRKVLIDLTLIKDPMFLIFGTSLCLFTLGSQSSAVFVPALGKEKGLDNIKAAYLISILGVTDAVAKICAGFVLDHKPFQKYRRFLYNLNVFLIAILIILCPFMESFTGFGILCAVYGVLNGINVSQKAIMLSEILGEENISSSFGLTICFQGLGALSGPPLSGLLKDTYQSYNEPFYFIASVVIAGACIMAAGNIYHSCQLAKRMKAEDTIPATADIEATAAAPIAANTEEEGEEGEEEGEDEDEDATTAAVDCISDTEDNSADTEHI